MVNRADCDDVYSEDVVQLRNKVQYSEQVQSLLKGTITTRDCGIKSSCLLNTLQYFHVVENSTVDILHDVLEGVCGRVRVETHLSFICVCQEVFFIGIVEFTSVQL